MNIGQKLKELRKTNNQTQEEIAALLLCDMEIYNRYENNKKQIPIELIAKLAIHYKVSSDYIYGLKDEFGNKIYDNK